MRRFCKIFAITYIVYSLYSKIIENSSYLSVNMIRRVAYHIYWTIFMSAGKWDTEGTSSHTLPVHYNIPSVSPIRSYIITLLTWNTEGTSSHTLPVHYNIPSVSPIRSYIITLLTWDTEGTSLSYVYQYIIFPRCQLEVFFSFDFTQCH